MDAYKVKQLASDASGVDIGRSYGVSPNTVYAIRNRRSWKCLSA